MIIDTGHSYKVVSIDGSKKLGEYGFKTTIGRKTAFTKAKKRLKQIEFFKRK